MKITGHKTDSMFRRYAIVTVDQQREALRRQGVPRATGHSAARETRHSYATLEGNPVVNSYPSE
jgi:hypothetical protein